MDLRSVQLLEMAQEALTRKRAGSKWATLRADDVGNALGLPKTHVRCAFEIAQGLRRPACILAGAQYNAQTFVLVAPLEQGLGGKYSRRCGHGGDQPH